MFAAAESGQNAQATESKEKMLHPQHFLSIIKANRGESALLWLAKKHCWFRSSIIAIVTESSLGVCLVFIALLRYFKWPLAS